QSLTDEHARIVEIDDLDAIVQREGCHREREAPSSEQSGLQALGPESSELLDEGRQLSVGEIEAAVNVGIVVPAVPLKDAGHPERPVLLVRLGARAPGEAAVGHP